MNVKAWSVWPSTTPVRASISVATRSVHGTVVSTEAQMGVIESALEVLLQSVGLEGILRSLLASFGRDTVQAILDAEYKAADAIADEAEKAKLGE